MKLNLEKLSKLERRLNIEVPIEKVSEAFDRVYKALQQQVTLKGFRKGKAPLAQIRSMYAGRVADDVARDLIQEYYVKGLQEHALNPITAPQVEFDAIQEEGPFKFSVQFDIRPEVELKRIEGLEIEKEILEENDKFVDETIERMRASKASEDPLIMERPAKLGDLATIDFEGIVDGKELDRGSAKAQTVEIGNSGFIEGFDTGLVGMTINETKKLDLKFPEDYHASEIAGKPVTFKVTLQRLGMKALPEVNDEFAGQFGDFKTLASLKDAIRTDWKQGEENRIKKDLKSRLIKALVAANPMDLPPGIVKEQKQALIHDMHNKMEQQGMKHGDFEEYSKKWDADFEASAKFIVSSSFLVNEIADKNELKCSDDDFAGRLETYAKQTGIDIARLKEYYGKSEQAANLRFQVTEEKVVDFLLAKAKIKEVPASKIPKEKE